MDKGSAMRRVGPAEYTLDASTLGERIGVEPADVFVLEPVLAYFFVFRAQALEFRP